MADIHEVHTHTESGGGAGAGMLLGIVLVLLVLVIAAFVFFGGAFRPSTSTAPSQPSNPTNVQVNPPAAPPKIDVNVKQEAPSQPAPAQPAPNKP